MPASNEKKRIQFALGKTADWGPPFPYHFAAAIRPRVAHEIVLSVTAMNTISISRRDFARLLGAGAAAALVRPAESFGKQPEHVSTHGQVVRLSANENAYGPSPKALKAMTDSFTLACRYPDEHNNVLIDKLAKLNDVHRDQILLGDGSSEILKLCTETFTDKEGGSLVSADPTFEAILEQAKTNGAEVLKVPLTSTYAHDLPRMLSSAKGGLIYICNPNNPTASITLKDELRDFIAKTPPEIMLLVDEAYFHFADSPDYESVIPLVKEYPNLIVARTFSKIYGMAGLRCGYCVAQPDKIELMRAQQSWDSVSIMAIVAARASLDDAAQLTNGLKNNSEVRKYVCGELDKLKFTYIPSEANFMMIDMRREVKPIIAAFKDKKVQVGRLFPPLPNHLRVTVGTKPQMERFLAVFKEVTA